MGPEEQSRRSAPGTRRFPPPRELGRLIWSRRRHVIRAWLWFVGSLAVLVQVLVWARPFTDTRVTAWIATAAAGILDLLGADGEVRGTLVTSSLGTVEIVRECTGLYPTAFFIAAVLAYPCAWRRRFLGIAIGIVSIQAINLVRVLTLIYIHGKFPAIFETAHLVVWQSLIVFFTVLIWVVWAVEIGDRPVQEAEV